MASNDLGRVLCRLAGTVVATVWLAGAALAFPIEVQHSLGTTVIPQEPERVVALIDRDADTLLALGVEPVGIRSLFGFGTGVGPWAQTALGDAQPVVWTGREINYEGIAALDPDLIVFANSGGEEEVYNLLSQIAPTVGLPEGALPWGATTEQTTLLIAEALGRQEDGEALLAELDAYLAEQAAVHPEFAGKTANYLDIYPGGIASYSQNHIVNELLYAVGFSPIPAVQEMPEGTSSVTVSSELLDQYDADVLLIYPYGRTLEQLIAEQPTLGALDSVQSGQAFVLDDLAFSTASVLSIPYALDELLPRVSTALEE